ncbi:MAG TPA: YigZ family protein [Brumimicrobium sp.]|nr:YigZ family protein [Brumimicrobium sp.]
MQKSNLLKIPTTYKTLKDTSEGLYKEKGSKFIGIATYCEDEEEAKELIARWRNEHHQARHLCWAYRFGINKDLYRANDDGEPSNSAGAPILGQIQSFDLTNVLIGVVRYYGGVKLGVGGLINAYRTAAKDAIENGIIVEEVVKDRFTMTFSYLDMPLIMDVVKGSEATINKQEFTNDCFLRIAIRIEATEQLLEKLADFTSLKIEKIGTY